MKLPHLIFPLLLLCILAGCGSSSSHSDTASFGADHGTSILAEFCPQFALAEQTIPTQDWLSPFMVQTSQAARYM